MEINNVHRKAIVTSLFPEKSENLLDIGCGVINSSYPYAQLSIHVTCIDWKMVKIEPIPTNTECVQGDFIQISLASNIYDTIIAADVFEHILLEEESIFIQKCISLLKPGGSLIISVPHRGTFYWLDPYLIKPIFHRLLWYLGLYKKLHNGSCDIRKSHQHYTMTEIVEKFKPLELKDVRYWGYLFDPVLSWVVSFNKYLFKLPGYQWLGNSCQKEFEQDYGKKSFNMAIRFVKSSDL